jgi:transcriptional regulator with PAS, ATPase and Fis domain
MAPEPRNSPSNIEAAMIRNALEQARRDTGLAARLLGISEAELQRRMRAYGITLDGSTEA